LAASVPRSLGALLVVVAVVGVSWAMITPPWQSPDSFTHYSYTESLATRFALPGRPGHNEASSSVLAAYRAAGVIPLQWSSPEVKPSWNPAAARVYRTASARLSRSNGAGITPSQANPPLYYAYAAAAYLAVGGDALDRVSAIQLAGVLLLLATVIGAWLLAGEVFGRRPLLQLTTAAVAGLQPMETFISTSVNPDALLVPLWTFWLWLGARVIKRGAPRRDVVALCAVTAAAILTKETAYAMLPPLVLALVLGWRARSAPGWREAAKTFGTAILVLYVPVQLWIIGANAGGRPGLTVAPATASVSHSPSSFLLHFLDYVWQFYLPKFPGQATIHVTTLPSLPWPRLQPGLPVWNIWVREGWGVFGWVDIYMTNWVYVVLAVLTAAVAALGVAIVVRLRDRLALSLFAFFGLTLLSLLAVVHEVEYQSLRANQGPFTQGRYVLPLVALFGLGVALIISRLPPRARGPSCAVLLVGLLALQVLALGTVARTYYT
jgi:4-amino-4-deoxy-L-arabinose transferase-like glycosyltransferase